METEFSRDFIAICKSRGFDPDTASRQMLRSSQAGKGWDDRNNSMEHLFDDPIASPWITLVITSYVFDSTFSGGDMCQQVANLDENTYIVDSAYRSPQIVIFQNKDCKNTVILEDLSGKHIEMFPQHQDDITTMIA